MAFAEPDYAGLWRELVELAEQYGLAFRDACRSERYLRRLRGGRRADEAADPLIDFVLARLRPTDTVLDVGAAGGRWALRLAPVVRQVTALEPAPELGQALGQNLDRAGLANVALVPAAWGESEVAPHDVVLCSHAMYGMADLPGFVRSLARHARRACALVMRHVRPDGVMGELARQVRGHPHDSPNFAIGYNVLLGMGIAADVVVDPATKHWEDASLEAAIARAKRHLYLDPADRSPDEAIGRLLARRLEPRGGQLRWPDGTCSALVWWSVTPAAAPERFRVAGTDHRAGGPGGLRSRRANSAAPSLRHEGRTSTGKPLLLPDPILCARSSREP